MICRPCQKAGDTLRAGRNTFIEQLSEVLAALYHRDCEDCDCQHKLGNPHQS